MRRYNIRAQRQQWPHFDRYIFMDELGQGSVQLELYHEPQEDGVTAYLFALWVNETARRYGLASALMDAAEKRAMARNRKSIALHWADYEAPQWTREWYERRGYEEFRSELCDDGRVYYLRKKLK